MALRCIPLWQALLKQMLSQQQKHFLYPGQTLNNSYVQQNLFSSALASDTILTFAIRVSVFISLQEIRQDGI